VESFKPILNVTLRIGLAAAFSSFAYWKMGGAIPAVLTIPIWGILLAKPILEGVAGYYSWAKKQPYVPWQGRYYEFGNIHIRVFEDDFGHLWFCDKDVLQVLGQTVSKTYQFAYGESDYRVIPGERLQGFSENAVILVVSRIRHPSAGKFKFWLEREVLAPHHNKREKAGLPSSARHQEKDPFRPISGSKD
jgi:hypothetical protein